MKYGLGVIGTSIKYRLNKWKILHSKIYHKPPEKKIQVIERKQEDAVNTTISS